MHSIMGVHLTKGSKQENPSQVNKWRSVFEALYPLPAIFAHFENNGGVIRRNSVHIQWQGAR